MESAATPTKPKRSRAKKVDESISPEILSQVKATIDHEVKYAGREAAAPMTHRERMAAVDARAAATRQRVLEDYTAKGYGPKPRTGVRWIGRRTKGLPFSRMVVEQIIPGTKGMPGVIVAKHPTRKRGLQKLTATPAILETFLPSLPASLSASMLGLN